MYLWRILLTILNSFDHNKENKGTSFVDWHPLLEETPIMKDFANWGATSFGESLFCLRKNALMHQNFRGSSIETNGQQE